MITINRRKISIIIAVLLLILAFPISLLIKENWNVSEGMTYTIQTFIIGFSIGMIVTSFLVPKN